ncbi:uncharacterized protein LOC131256751 isoform X2 [Magnolia sinica]|uniref:uncharacterized protein LOC131256751 isoform X2 n=1 Tax=Magnolia sinica TaxID=86752 RepID=UPI002659D226|nr:uncharacterized protein LOC131256751 isoform X2 [Magnolia sinica]
MTMVENCFDRWQKDEFFSAAEAVQESADVMVSIYRTWERERREGFQSDDSDELRRELHTTLGTAKWQLEEFEKAVKMSHRYGSSDHTVSRHRQFVIAIEDQISRIEKALQDSLIEEGKQPLRWVQLDEEERDDLAAFLSSAPGTLQEIKNGHSSFGPTMENNYLGTQPTEDAEIHVDADFVKGFKEIVTISKDASYVVELEAKELPKTKDEMHNYGEGSNGPTRTWSSPDIGSWKIVIADEDVERNTSEARPETPTHAFNVCGLVTSIESTTKSKWLRNNFRKAKAGEHLLPKRVSSYLNSRGITRFSQGINMLTERSRNCFSSCKEDSNVSHVQQLFGRVGGFKRQVQGSQYYMQFGRSLQITLVIMLTIFIIVPFMFYAN